MIKNHAALDYYTVFSAQRSFPIGEQYLLEFKPISRQIQHHIPGAFFLELVACAGDDYQPGIFVDPAELADVIHADIVIQFALQDQHGDGVSSEDNVSLQLLVQVVADR